MAYNETLADRIRERLKGTKKLEEKTMFGGICFMIDDKMCVGVSKEDMMCRIDPEEQESALLKKGAKRMEFGGRTMTGFIFVDEEGTKSKKDFEYWINLCLEFNPKAKSSKKKK